MKPTTLVLLLTGCTALAAPLCAGDRTVPVRTPDPVVEQSAGLIGDTSVTFQFEAVTENTLRVSVRSIGPDGHPAEIPASSAGFAGGPGPGSPSRAPSMGQLPAHSRAPSPEEASTSPARPQPSASLPRAFAPGALKVGSWQVEMSGDPVILTVCKAGRVVQRLTFDPAGAVSLPLGNEPVLGLGEGGAQFDRRGGYYPFQNGQRYEGRPTFGARVAAPFLISTGGWALFLNAPRGTFDLRSGHARIQPEPGAAPLPIDLFVLDSRDPAMAMRDYARLTGAVALPPRWALGYMQSHRTLADAAEMIRVAENFRTRHLPCDALIYLGTGFCPNGWNTGFDSFEFNPRLFPRGPAEVFTDLHANHFKVVLHVVPPNFKLHRRGATEDAAVNAREIAGGADYWARHRAVFAAGTDGWWADEGDWYNIPQRLARHQMYYEGPLADRPDERPWSLHRNGFPGMNPYGGWLWSGDVAARWDTLAAQVGVGINTSLSLTPFWGTDTGGFINTEESSAELFVRWFQFSAFTPSFRSHGRGWYTRLPWGWDEAQPRVSEGEKFPPLESRHDPAVEPICRAYLNLRYQLLPYTYTLAREAHDTGLPLMRALWLHYPADPAAAARGDEYLWGRDLLVAPVVTARATSRRLYLPPGDWYDWWTNEKTAGGRMIERAVDLRTLPLYARAGAIVPLDPIRQYTSEPVAGPTELRVFSGRDGTFVLYDDDGHSIDPQQAKPSWTHITWDDTRRTLRVAPDPTTSARVVRSFEVHVLPSGEVKKIAYAGTPLEVTF